MSVGAAALRMLRNEARSLLVRVDKIESFALHTPMVPAASLPIEAQAAIERHLSKRRSLLRFMVKRYIAWLESPEGRMAEPDFAQRRFSFLRLRFIAILTQLDIFADVINQRSEHDTGVWLSGLDALAADALDLEGGYYEAPPVVCFLERGPGAAIRRARTRLPGGDDNPVAVIQVPRERMIGSGIASSLVHEVGHQGAAMLELEKSLRPVLREAIRRSGDNRTAWVCWERWISEILADLWAVGRLGAIGTVGLMTVVSLPRTFVFRVNLEDPHPAPWIRVKLSCAMGMALYPDPQWQWLSAIWDSFYPLEGLDEKKKGLFSLLQQEIPGFVSLLAGHRPASLGGKTLKEALSSADRLPESLRDLYLSWKSAPKRMKGAPPSLIFAAIGQAKIDGSVDAGEESMVLTELLKYWALKTTTDLSEICSDVYSSSKKQRMVKA